MTSARATLLSCVTATLLATSAAARPATPSGQGTTMSTGGVNIWYEVRSGGASPKTLTTANAKAPSASKTPLVLLAGGPGFDHVYFLVSDVWDKLGAHRPVVVYDQRGTGRSGELKPGTSCTLADQVADLEALRIKLGVERLDLLGHSWGGYLAMAYATRFPEHVAHLILCDSAAPRWSDTEYMLKNLFPEATERRDQDEFLEATGEKDAGAASVREYLSMLFVSPKKRDEFLAAANQMHLNRAVNEALNADLLRVDMGPTLARLKMPVLVLTGRFDANVAPSTAWKIHKAIPGSRFEVFEQSGHLPFFEEPEAFARVVERFLQ